MLKLLAARLTAASLVLAVLVGLALGTSQNHAVSQHQSSGIAVTSTPAITLVSNQKVTPLVHWRY